MPKMTLSCDDVIRVYDCLKEKGIAKDDELRLKFESVTKMQCKKG